MTTPGRLTVQSNGRVTGPATITYNDPFPCPNGQYGSGAIHGVVMHTMVGDLPGTIATFNNPAAQASAHFGIAQNGSVHQFGPIGKGWVAWAEMAGNFTWYSIEHADHGNTENPLTGAQIIASAQLVEVLSRLAGFPLQLTDSVEGRGYGTHVMGGAAWGGHTCPGPGPRAGQRAKIITMAEAIRKRNVVTEVNYTTTGTESLLQLATSIGTKASSILRRTAIHDGTFPSDVAAYINAGDLSAQMPQGLVLRVPG
jgi:hypothetical protein